MKKQLLLALLVLFGLAASATHVDAQDDPTAPFKAATMRIKKEKDRLAVQSGLVSFSEAPRTHEFFRNCYGFAIFPTIGKGGFGVGGSHGKGWVFKLGQVVGYSKMTQVTVGFQAGGQAYTQVVFFEDEHAFTRFTSGIFEFSAQASAVALTEGANAAASTAGGAGAGAGNAQSKSGYTDGMAVFTKAKGGLMYEAAIGGQQFRYRPIK
jgi:lipid-binding SYLF domain-containing protein